MGQLRATGRAVLVIAAVLAGTTFQTAMAETGSEEILAGWVQPNDTSFDNVPDGESVPRDEIEQDFEEGAVVLEDSSRDEILTELYRRHNVARTEELPPSVQSSIAIEMAQIARDLNTPDDPTLTPEPPQAEEEEETAARPSNNRGNYDYYSRAECRAESEGLHYKNRYAGCWKTSFRYRTTRCIGVRCFIDGDVRFNVQMLIDGRTGGRNIGLTVFMGNFRIRRINGPAIMAMTF